MAIYLGGHSKIQMDEERLKVIYGIHSKQGCFMSWEEWKPLVEKAHALLTERAKKLSYGRITITYGEVGAKIGLYPLSDFRSTR